MAMPTIIEIHRVIREALPFLNGAQYAAFVRENPEMYERTRRRVISYWNCYCRSDRQHELPSEGRFPDRTGYPAFYLLMYFDSLLEAPQ